MPTLILMPQLPDGAQTARIVKWLVAGGDDIAPGDVIAEFDCGAGAVFLIEAADGGRVSRLLVADGTGGLAAGVAIAEIDAAHEGAEGGDQAQSVPPSAGSMAAEPPAAQPQVREDRGLADEGPAAPPNPAAADSQPTGPTVASARLLRRGTAATIVAYLDQDELGLAVAGELFRSVGLDVEVIALDTMHGPGLELVCASVSRTGRLVVVEPYLCDWPYAAEIAAEVTARAFDDLDAPPLTVRGERAHGTSEGQSDRTRAVAKLVAAVRRICYLS